MTPKFRRSEKGLLASAQQNGGLETVSLALGLHQNLSCHLPGKTFCGAGFHSAG